MKPGPQTGAAASSTGRRSSIDTARLAWGASIPDWVEELAQAADRLGQKKAGELIGYSNGAVSQVLAAKYGGDVGRIEERVRGALMGLTVTCPVIGEMSRDTCLDWQAKPKAATSALRMRMFHACRNNCPNFRPRGGN